MASTQRELKAKGIQSNTKEYLAITFESVLRGEANSEDQSYTSLVEKYDILKSMPEHMQDISYRPFLMISSHLLPFWRMQTRLLKTSIL